MKVFLTSVFLFASAASASANNDKALIERYFEALSMAEVFEILRAEGIEAGVEIAEDDESITVSPAWEARLASIYSIDKMEALFRSAMLESENIEDSEDAIAFFESDLGKTIVRIELDARTALNNEELEKVVRGRVEKMRDGDPDRIALYDEFIDANDLIESNVMGALNSNLAFYRGMATSENYAEAMTESFMISTVWGQEPEIRQEMEDWTINFSVLAYGSLQESEMQSYIDISKTNAGQKLNTALFAGFDAIFEMQSFELGRAMAEFMIGEDT